MATFISIIIFLTCILLILTVLIQNPKGGGLSSEFSSANQIGGVQQTADFLERATWSLAIGVMVLTLIQAAFTTTGQEQEQQKGNPLEEVIDEQMDQQAPMTPNRAPGGEKGGQSQQGAGQKPAGQGQGKGSDQQSGGEGSSAIENAIEQEGSAQEEKQ